MKRERISNAPRVAVTETDLLRYVDGLLDGEPARKDAVETFLAEHPQEAVRIADYIAQNEAIQALYGPIYGEPLPPRLWDLLETLEGGPTPARPGRRRVAVGIAVLLAAAAGGWLLALDGTSAPVAAVADTTPSAHTLLVTPAPAAATPQGSVGAGKLLP